jgi:hypothetical protein
VKALALGQAAKIGFRKIIQYFLEMEIKNGYNTQTGG